MIKEFVQFFVSGLLLAIEFLLVFGVLFAALAAPYAIAIYQLGVMPGSKEIDWALFTGVILMGAWGFFLIKGGRKKIRKYFAKIIELSATK